MDLTSRALETQLYLSSSDLQLSMTDSGLRTKKGPFLPRPPDRYTSREIVWRRKENIIFIY